MVQVHHDLYQVYKFEVKGQLILSPNDVEADQSSATLSLFFEYLYMTI